MGVVQILLKHKADPDTTDSRKVSCLMAAFRAGQSKVVKQLVRSVRQYPSDAECRRLISTITDKVCIDALFHSNSLTLVLIDQGTLEKLSSLYGSNNRS